MKELIKRLCFILSIALIFNISLTAHNNEDLQTDIYSGWYCADTLDYTHPHSGSATVTYKIDYGSDYLIPYLTSAKTIWGNAINYTEDNSSPNVIKLGSPLSPQAIASIQPLSFFPNASLHEYTWLFQVRYSLFDSLSTPSKNQALAHEIGHTYGLFEQQYDNTEIMYYTDSPNTQTVKACTLKGLMNCTHTHGLTQGSHTLQAPQQYPASASTETHIRRCSVCDAFYFYPHEWNVVDACHKDCILCFLPVVSHAWVHATCTDYAFCSNCQLINQSSPPLGHMLSAYQHNATQHWKECSRPICSSPIVGLANHGNYYYTKINDTSHAKICGTNCGDSVTLNHNWSSTYQNNTSQHWYPCIQNCEAENSKANHSNAYYYYNSNQHKYGCLYCNYVQSTSDHTYGSPQQYNYAMHIRTCSASGCGTNIYQSHSWSYGSYNSSQHYQSCSCGYGAWVDHSGSYCPCGYSPPPGCPPHDCYFVNHYQYTQSTCYIMQYECSNCTYVDNDLTMVGGHSPPPDYSWGDYTCLDCGMTVWG